MDVRTKYDSILSQEHFDSYLKMLKNKIYKLLPLREEGAEWERFLETIQIELSGLNKLVNNNPSFISLIAKLESLLDLEDFMVYRKTIFECLNEVEDLHE